MKKGYIFILLLSILFIASLFYDSTSPHEYFDKAVVLEEKGKYEEAIKMLDKAIEKRPEFRRALLYRGFDKSELGDYQGAIVDYKKIIDFDPNNTLVLTNIGYNYEKLNQYDDAIKYFSRAMETEGAIKPGKILFSSNIFDKDDSGDYDVYLKYIQYERGVAYTKNKQFELAIKDLEEAINYDYSGKGNALLSLSTAYLGLNDTLNAKKYLIIADKYGMLDAKELYNAIH